MADEIDPKQHFLEHAQRLMRGEVQGPDLVFRSKREEVELNQRFARVFNGKDADRLLAYLRSITLDAVAPPGVTSESLHRLEGMRFVVQVICNRVSRGRKS